MAGHRATTGTQASQPIAELNVLLIDDSPADSARLASSPLPFLLSLSVGVAGFPVDAAGNLEAMLARADELLYEMKRGKKPRLREE